MVKGRKRAEPVTPTAATAERSRTHPSDIETRYRDLLAHLPVGVYRTTADGEIVEANQAAAEMLGFESVDELRSVDVGRLYVRPQERLEHWEELGRSGVHPGEFELRRRDGTTIWVRDYPRVVRDARGTVRYCDGIIADITERKRMEQAIREMAYHDELTGLPNRKLLADRLAVALAKARRGQGRLALLYLDLDGFKDVNDQRGHAVGDALLREAARRLAAALRTSDTVARIGGDEFTVLVTDLASEAAAAEVARKLIRVLARPFAVTSPALTVTASVGIAIYPSHGATEDALMSSADTAMYRAKAQGGNRSFSAGD